DFTTSTTWTPEKVNSIKTRILYYYTGGGGGCYPNFTKAIVYSDHHYSFKAPNEIQIGEDILCWNERDGVHLCRVTGIDKHSGEWKLLNFSIANLSLVVTDNHPIPSPELNKTMEAKEFKPGMKLRVLLNGSISLAEISSIEELNFIGEVYDIKINESSILLLLSNPPSNKFSSLDSLSAIDAEIKTYYVDWLPVRINYSVGQTNKIIVEIKEPSNFSIYVVDYSHELKRYYRSREIEVLAGSVEKVGAIINESISAFMAMNYETLRGTLGYGFFTSIEIPDENLNYFKGEYLPRVRRSSERRAFYFDEDFNQSMAVVRIGIH
ncbi:MAG: hypothetical protein QW507_02220, partial [Candidatus Nanoarchaeia archaeon]|nr:hypothetical protein [Candidatus Haiyanarchaeum thermophilum]